MEKTRLSDKGQIVIPKSVREHYRWKSGTEFVVIDIDGGIFLKPLKPFKQTHIREVLGCTGYRGARKSFKDMEKAIEKGITGKK
ncbi:MAG: hypothetical protein A2161_15435 [Candidatus Schekmanbacteria bacterium RBG_13_48_7]|uniref:SpoVT-AbrB domain-containing protein n=1 Tax=Candidatus Schekmanbacteria bacterium RBG_13_48_7 TaxID=1817878 RepID=A0A1F7S1A3_9BACT|nr:MAG: hypothetical protein A2161_15435 [Candidatus Schekmanbacteria bacterium RBG_13_48_7]